MAKTDRLKRYLDAGVAFTEITQQRRAATDKRPRKTTDNSQYKMMPCRMWL